jgi:hypothetical protein
LTADGISAQIIQQAIQLYGNGTDVPEGAFYSSFSGVCSVNPSPSPINVAESVGDLDIVLRSLEIRRRSLRRPVGVMMRREVVKVQRSARSVSRVNPVILLMNLTVSPIVHNLQVSHVSLPNLSGVLKDHTFSKCCVDFFTHIHSFYYLEYVNSLLKWGCYE